MTILAAHIAQAMPAELNRRPRGARGPLGVACALRDLRERGSGAGVVADLVRMSAATTKLVVMAPRLARALAAAGVCGGRTL